MKNIKVFVVIFIFSVFLTIFGFIIDSDEYVPNLMQNTLDFLLMTTLFFGFFSVLYLMGFLLIKVLGRG